MRCVLALLIAKVVLVAATRSVNYCGAKMCGHTNAHTFCHFPPGPSPRCRGYMDAHLTTEEKVRIVARLNRRRSEAASGRLKRLPTAGNMLKLRWVEELAREAQRWADQCRPPSTPDERDTCRDLYSTSVGQCVASVVGEAPGLRVESMVDLWYMQNMLYKGNVSYYSVPMTNVSYYGDFAQMIWARSYMVGCGRSRFMSEVSGRLRSVERLVCNIAPRGPVPSRALWAPAVPTSVCPPRSIPDPDLTALCNYQHDLDVSSDTDGAMTIEEHVLLSIVLEIENKEVLNYLGSLDELYMTKLAVVTMGSSVSTVPYYNLVQKRDILETLGLDESVVHIDNVIVENDINDFVNATRIVVRIQQTTDDNRKPVTRRTNLIGRPKSYNIEDLNDDGIPNIHEDKNEPEDIPLKDFSKIDPDVYLEYAVLDNQEENTTSEFISPTSAMASRNQIFGNESQEITLSVENLPNITVNEEKQSGYGTISPIMVIPYNDTASPHDNFANLTNKMNTSTDATDKANDDYLTDTETVRELQEALDRMERSMEEIQPPAGKVRRELRGNNLQEFIPDKGNEERSEEIVQKDGTSQNELELESLSDTNLVRQDRSLDRSNLTDKTPMLNMVLKYLPYLKPYQKEILGSATSSGYRFVVSYALFSFDVVLMYF